MTFCSSLFKAETKQGKVSGDFNEGDFTIIDNCQNDEYMLTLEFTEKAQNVDEKSRDAEFIIVVDKSGSMQGTPWRQVQEALIKMLHITNSDARISVKALAYNHCATLLDITGDINIDSKNIQEIRSGGNKYMTHYISIVQSQY